MEPKLLWRRPQLRTDEMEHKERKPTWLALFYDLVFVAVVAQLSHTLAGDVTWLGVAKYCLLFVPVWWAWIGSTFYNDRFETDDLSHRIWTFIQMIAVASLAFHVHDGFGESSRGFSISYIAVRVMIIFLWVRAGFHSPEARKLTNRYAGGVITSVLFWFISIFVPAPLRFLLWAVGLLIDIGTPLTTLKIQRTLPKLSSSHLPERFGLFTIIVLGESIVGVVAGAAETHHMTWAVGAAGVFGLALSFSMWWLYFDRIASRRAKPNPWWLAAWVYNHLVLVIGLTAIGAGTLQVVAHNGAVLSPPIMWLICGSVAVSFFAMALFEYSLAGAEAEPTVARTTALIRIIAGLLSLTIAVVGGNLPSGGVLGLLALLAVIQVALIARHPNAAAIE